MIYGYCRISRKTQNIERQERNIRAAYPAANIVSEAYTGTKLDGRDGLKKILTHVKAGDVIVFDSVSRMSRNAAEGVKLYNELLNKGVDLVFIKEPHINTEVYKQALNQQLQSVHTGEQAADDMVNGMLKLVQEYMAAVAAKQIQIAFEQAEKEVMDLHQRTSEGLTTAKLNGKRVGTEAGRKLTVKKAAPAQEFIRSRCKEFGGDLTDGEAMQLLKIARNTFYKYKAAVRAEQEKAAD